MTKQAVITPWFIPRPLLPLWNHVHDFRQYTNGYYCVACSLKLEQSEEESLRITTKQRRRTKMEAKDVMLTQDESREIWDTISGDAKSGAYAEVIQEALLRKVIKWLEDRRVAHLYRPKLAFHTFKITDEDWKELKRD